MKNNKSQKLILASSSPRRREILADAGYFFDIVEPKLDEPEYDEHKHNLTPEEFAQALAYFKAMQIAENNPDAIVIGADTIVVCNEQLIGKPKDANHAREILKLLSHNRHCVITGVSVVNITENKRLFACDKTWITMKPMSETQIEEYIKSGHWKGKAGAYALQQGGDKFVSKLEGSYSNVIGLPIELTSTLLENFGLEKSRKK